MNIQLNISIDTLGDDNSDDDNQRYAEAVSRRVESEYPRANVSVEITAPCFAGCSVLDARKNAEDIKEDVVEAANRVWEEQYATVCAQYDAVNEKLNKSYRIILSHKAEADKLRENVLKILHRVPLLVGRVIQDMLDHYVDTLDR